MSRKMRKFVPRPRSKRTGVYKRGSKLTLGRSYTKGGNYSKPQNVLKALEVDYAQLAQEIVLLFPSTQNKTGSDKGFLWAKAVQKCTKLLSALQRLLPSDFKTFIFGTILVAITVVGIDEYIRSGNSSILIVILSYVAAYIGLPQTR